MDNKELAKYQTAADICAKVMKTLLEMITSETELRLVNLSNFGNTMIVDECTKVYKREKDRGIAFPVCISLNHCAGHFIPENTEQIIQKGDVVKIELGVTIGGCIAMLGETIVYGQIDKESEQALECLDKLAQNIEKSFRANKTNDNARMKIESLCTNYNCFPMENTFSFQQELGHLRTQDSKYMVLNHKKYYNDNNELYNEADICYQFEEGEVYTVNLVIIPSTIEHQFIEHHKPHVYRYNDCFYNLKLKSSRAFINTINKNHAHNAFSVIPYTSEPKWRIGIKEASENCILDDFPVLYTQSGDNVYFKKFTWIVGNKLRYK